MSSSLSSMGTPSMSVSSSSPPSSSTSDFLGSSYRHNEALLNYPSYSGKRQRLSKRISLYYLTKLKYLPDQKYPILRLQLEPELLLGPRSPTLTEQTLPEVWPTVSTIPSRVSIHREELRPRPSLDLTCVDSDEILSSKFG